MIIELAPHYSHTINHRTSSAASVNSILYRPFPTIHSSEFSLQQAFMMTDNYSALRPYLKVRK